MSGKAKKKLTKRERQARAEFKAELRRGLEKKKRQLIAATTIEQRRTFIEALRAGKTFGEAMQEASIEDQYTAVLIYDQNSFRPKMRFLVEPEEVR